MSGDPREKLAYDETFDCIQCGSCLPACPTYKTMGKETQSPRGRINLVKMAAEGKIALDKLREPISLCLGCRACERVCPTNVKYGKILESAKEALYERETETGSPVKRFEEDLFYKQIFPNRHMLHTASNILWFYQKSGLKTVAHLTGMNKLLPHNLETFEQATPRISSPGHRHQRPKKLSPEGRPLFKVGFFTGCVMDAVFDRINDLSMKLLAASGCEVVAVEGQTCCGALHDHGGRTDLTRELAKQNIEVFEQGSFDYIVNNAGGCGAMLGEYAHLFADDETWRQRAERFAEKSVDISVLLARLTLPIKRDIHRRITFQPSCHMTNVQKVIDEPLQLIRRVKGIDFHPLDDPDFCCGSAGVYNIVNYEESMKILDVKMADVKDKNPDLIVTTNPGCLLQMKAGIERENLSDHIRAVHLVELLAAACDLN
ncbi:MULTISPECIES: (Fe-S)-binding protein [unclassified Sporolactobacillus]|uniref:(Fe-S)-binding protein n=1 Tax=unclassified Sporolactobacillus TaxID=2628533 RepID=UPI00236805D9|nr:(Fe-S)-binding protein [Sporolactobacillus sp. CQH2019]MDD9146994.1 (Fe-S)-binding protein [Sporolactobacillus sp. CQH2019]